MTQTVSIPKATLEALVKGLVLTRERLKTHTCSCKGESGESCSLNQWRGEVERTLEGFIASPHP
jgi:hypothetical protein